MGFLTTKDYANALKQQKILQEKDQKLAQQLLTEIQKSRSTEEKVSEDQSPATL
jgi:hypothetical protein